MSKYTKMSRAEARAVLDCVREGDPSIPEWSIYQALYTLGDCVIPDYPIVEHLERGAWEGRLNMRPAHWCALIP